MTENLAYYIVLFAMGAFLIKAAQLDNWFCILMRWSGTGLMAASVVLTLKGVL